MYVQCISFLMESPALILQRRDWEGHTPLDLVQTSLEGIPETFQEYIRSMERIKILYEQFAENWMSFLPGGQNTFDNFEGPLLQQNTILIVREFQMTTYSLCRRAALPVLRF